MATTNHYEKKKRFSFLEIGLCWVEVEWLVAQWRVGVVWLGRIATMFLKSTWIKDLFGMSDWKVVKFVMSNFKGIAKNWSDRECRNWTRWESLSSNILCIGPLAISHWCVHLVFTASHLPPWNLLSSFWWHLVTKRGFYN